MRTNIYNKHAKSFVAYLPAAYPNAAYTVDAALALHRGGVNILEIGVPFSDPIADGPVIQTAMEHALLRHIDVAAVFEIVKKIKSKIDVPVVLFSYYNPLLSQTDFFVRAKDAGVDSVLIVDLPLEESTDFFNGCKKVGVTPVALVSPTTSMERLAKINQNCDSFIYYVCRNATTGMHEHLPNDYQEKMQQIAKNTDLPVVAGFGISSKQQARQALQHASGFVVGSYFVKAIQAGVSANELQTLAEAIDPREEY